MYFDKELTNNIGRKEYKQVPIYEKLPLHIIKENERTETERSYILSDIDKYENELKSLIKEYATDLYWIFSNGKEEMIIRHIRIDKSKLEIEMSSIKSDTKTQRILSYKI